jgi:hypothetical protein
MLVAYVQAKKMEKMRMKATEKTIGLLGRLPVATTIPRPFFMLYMHIMLLVVFFYRGNRRAGALDASAEASVPGKTSVEVFWAREEQELFWAETSSGSSTA